MLIDSSGEEINSSGDEVVAAGPLDRVLAHKQSLTAKYLCGDYKIEVPIRRVAPNVVRGFLPRTFRFRRSGKIRQHVAAVRFA